MKKDFATKSIGIMFQAAGYKSLTDSNNSPMFSQVFSSGSLPAFFNAIFTTAISVGAILAVLEIAYAGWEYMSSDLLGKKNDAKDRIRNAVMGLMLLLGIWIILNQINPDILNLNVLRDIQSN